MINKKTGIVAVIIILSAVISGLFLVNGNEISSENSQNFIANNSTRNNISCGSCDDFTGNSTNTTANVVSSAENYHNSSSSSCCKNN